jgi:hypothetical protein
MVMAERVRGILQAAIVAPAPCQREWPGERPLKTTTEDSLKMPETAA